MNLPRVNQPRGSKNEGLFNCSIRVGDFVIRGSQSTVIFYFRGNLASAEDHKQCETSLCPHALLFVQLILIVELIANEKGLEKPEQQVNSNYFVHNLRLPLSPHIPLPLIISVINLTFFALSLSQGPLILMNI